jgi:serine/threonine-protein kinase
MASEPTSLSEREERFGEIAFAYLRAREEGRHPDPREWLDRYPEFAPELASFFSDQDEVDRLGAPLREMAGVANRPPTERPARTEAQEDPAGSGPPPAAFGDYEVLGEMARGGMGVVYRARQRGLNRLVALKVVRAGEWASPEEVRRFRNEAETVALLDHPSIVPVYEVGEQAGQLYFSMKLVEDGSLARQPDRFRDDPRAAASLLATVARAVHHAHQRGVLHRDLKPSNILLDEGGRPHVTDFGLARRVEADSSLTQSGAIVGTPSYMAPEQATGQKGAVTTATDVYGLGAVLYALLTGRPPFQAESALDTLVQVREREPDPPGGVNSRVPRDLETICLKCLAKEPQRRYGSALALAEDLERFLAGQPIQARPVGVWERGVKWARRRPLVVAAVAGLVVAFIALGAGAGWVLSDRAARQREAQNKVRESEDKVRDALEAAGPGLRHGNPWDPALIAAAQRAVAQLNSGLVGPDLRRKVEQLQKDVRMLADLERLRLDKISSLDGKSVSNDPVPELANAFREYGIDVETLEPDVASALVRDSAICETLVASLDDWASMLTGPAKKEQRQSLKRLLEVTRTADPDPWRDRLRGMLLSGDDSDLTQLARSAPVEELPRSTLVLLEHLVAVRSTASGPVMKLVRRAQRRFPADFWINHTLAYALQNGQPPQLEEAIGFFRAAVALRPGSYGTHVNLGRALSDKGDVDEAIDEYREAIHLKKDSAIAHMDFGVALRRKGMVEEAIAEYREAIRLKKDIASAHSNLGAALYVKGDVDEAIDECREALRLEKDDAVAHTNLGLALRAKGNVEEAIAEYREAIRLEVDLALAHNALGQALLDRGQVDGAIAEFRKAIRAKKDYSDAHTNLGIALVAKGQLDEAVVEFREAIRSGGDSPNAAKYHCNLGKTLNDKGDVDGAIEEYRAAIRLKVDFADAHCVLGQILCSKGQFTEALTYLRRGHELGSKNQRWPIPSAQWVKECEQLVELDARLPRVLKEEIQPAGIGERIALAQLCQMSCKSLYLAAYRFYTAAFAEQPNLADDLQGQHRYNAACAAALAGCGHGKDARDLPDREYVGLRRQALEWLRADLAANRQLLEKEPDKARPLVREHMQHWQQDTDFAGVRGPDALAKLPEAERQEWQKLWADVADTLARAGDKAAPEK